MGRSIPARKMSRRRSSITAKQFLSQRANRRTGLLQGTRIKLEKTLHGRSNAWGAIKDKLTRWLALHRGSMRECFVIQTTFKLIGEFTGNPEVVTLIGEENRLAERAELLVSVIKDAPDYIHTRYGILPNERPVEELREEFAKTFEPVDIKHLMPTEEAIEQARETINFTIIRDNPEQLYAILRNETAVNMGKGAY